MFLYVLRESIFGTLLN